MLRLGPWDALFLATETPSTHSHTVKLAILEAAGPLDMDAVRRTVARTILGLPPLRYQLMNVPFGFHRPLWRENVDVDLRYHVRRGQLASPGGRRGLELAVGRLASEQLDLGRPPWEIHVFEGFEAGRVAGAVKIHHALGDGVAFSNLIELAVATAGAGIAVERPPADPVPGTAELARLALQEHARQWRGLPHLVRRSVHARIAQRNQAAPQPARLAPAVPAPEVFWNRPLQPGRDFAAEQLPLATLRELSRRLGATINDTLLGIVAGGLRTVLLEHGERADRPLVISVPVDIERPARRVSGNRLSGLFVSLPVDLDDPLARCREAAAAARFAKERHALVDPGLGQDWVARVPPRLMQRYAVRSARRSEGFTVKMNLGISNVRGPREQLRLAGAPIVELWSPGPLHFHCGIQLSVLSYADGFSLGALTDTAILPDAGVVVRAIRASFHEVGAALAGAAHSASRPRTGPSRGGAARQD